MKMAFSRITWEALLSLFDVPSDARVVFADLVPDQRIVRVFWESAELAEVGEGNVIPESSAQPRSITLSRDDFAAVYSGSRGES